MTQRAMLKISFKGENFLLPCQFLSFVLSLYSEGYLNDPIALRTLFGTAYPEAAR